MITLSKRLGHATPQVTRSVYADEIEEANDSAIRKARVEAMFSGTKMAALLAASDGGSPQEEADAKVGRVVPLADVRSSEKRAAAASG